MPNTKKVMSGEIKIPIKKCYTNTADHVIKELGFYLDGTYLVY